MLPFFLYWNKKIQGLRIWSSGHCPYGGQKSLGYPHTSGPGQRIKKKKYLKK